MSELTKRQQFWCGHFAGTKVHTKDPLCPSKGYWLEGCPELEKGSTKSPSMDKSVVFMTIGDYPRCGRLVTQADYPICDREWPSYEQWRLRGWQGLKLTFSSQSIMTFMEQL